MIEKVERFRAEIQTELFPYRKGLGERRVPILPAGPRFSGMNRPALPNDMKEGERTVLDNSMILFESALNDGNKHDPHRLPIVLAGRAGGRLASGQHLVYTEDSPAANLYVSMLDAFGTPVE
jgi:hypothetical protein